MTTTDRPARQAVYSALMWPQWNPRSESHGVGGVDTANELLDALAAETLAPVLHIVSETTAAANDGYGLDINDLVDRLREAGYPLPDDEEDA